MISWFKKEFKHILPVTIFFLVAFTLVEVTDRAINKNASVYFSFFSCIVASLIMGKVVLIGDSLPFIQRYSAKPLIYVTLWKTLIYIICSITLRLIEHAVHGIYEGQSALSVIQGVIEHAEKHHFWLAQSWLAFLLIIFVGYRELIVAIGYDKVRTLFFGK